MSVGVSECPGAYIYFRLYIIIDISSMPSCLSSNHLVSYNCWLCGPRRESNPGPPLPERGIMPLDHADMRPLLYVVRGEVNVITETGPLAMAGIFMQFRSHLDTIYHFTAENDNFTTNMHIKTAKMLSIRRP